MNILGVGGPELLIILVLMYVIFGPKRMIYYARVLGQYVAKFRRMWEETVDVLQQEFDDAGMDVKIPREPPTRSTLNREAAKMLGSVTDPLKDTLKEVDSEVSQISKVTAATAATARNATSTTRTTNGYAAPKKTTSTTVTRKPASGSQDSGFGSWSSHDAKPDFGAWSAGGQKQDDEE